MSIREIFEGWRNHILPPSHMKERIQAISEERLSICRACPFHSSNRKNYQTMRKDEHCTDCGCPLVSKTKCLSCHCPQHNWEAELTPEEEQIIHDDEKNIQS